MLEIKLILNHGHLLLSMIKSTVLWSHWLIVKNASFSIWRQARNASRHKLFLTTVWVLIGSIKKRHHKQHPGTSPSLPQSEFWEVQSKTPPTPPSSSRHKPIWVLRRVFQDHHLHHHHPHLDGWPHLPLVFFDVRALLSFELAHEQVQALVTKALGISLR